MTPILWGLIALSLPASLMVTLDALAQAPAHRPRDVLHLCLPPGVLCLSVVLLHVCGG